MDEILANGLSVGQHIEGVVAASLVLGVLAAEPAKPLLAADIVVGEVAPPLLEDLLCNRERNRIKGLLFSQGISSYEPLRRDRPQRLEDLRTGDGRSLPTHLKTQISREQIGRAHV